MYLVFAKDLLSNSYPSNGFVGSNIFLSEVCGVGMQVSVFPSVLLVLGIKPRWVVGPRTGGPRLCHCGVLLPFCGFFCDDLQLH